ncbi:MAG: T9SS type A sorting domain-containing protein [Bacteroidia bacterium]
MFSFSVKIKAQNLVPNYSFENMIQCITGYNQFTGYVKDWTGQAGGGGLCYFTSQCSGYESGVPSNICGHQYAHTGVAYAGIYTYFDSAASGVSNYRNYIQDSLINPLIEGKKYYVTFYVSLADTFNFSCNNLGAYFSDSALIWSGTKVKSYLHPQVSNDIVHNPLTDKINWMRVSGSFTATGGEQYIIIGNFVDDAHSDATYFNVPTPGGFDESAYYYIDDVIVSTDSIYADSLFTGVNEIKPVKASVKVYPNPANSLIDVAVDMQQLKSGSICLYNTTGQVVKCEELSDNITSISINKLSAGLYYYRILNSNGSLIKADKIIIVH